jgi:hypothetical protein
MLTAALLPSPLRHVLSGKLPRARLLRATNSYGVLLPGLAAMRSASLQACRHEPVHAGKTPGQGHIVWSQTTLPPAPDSPVVRHALPTGAGSQRYAGEKDGQD